MNYPEKRNGYFPVLDALRLVASSSVVLSHSIVYYKGFPSSKLRSFTLISDAGYFGVVFFFVLSGFLITYLLMEEKEHTGSISVGNFYMRRILRIWPLYYLLIILSYFVFPQIAGSNMTSIFRPLAVILYFCFLPNIVPFVSVPGITTFHTYTIGYEEQFYFFWPVLFKKLTRGVLPVLLLLFLLPLVTDYLYEYLFKDRVKRDSGMLYVIKAILLYLKYFKLPAFVAGGIAAWYYKNGMLKAAWLLRSNLLTYLLLALIVGFMFFGASEEPGYIHITSFLFALLILNIIRSGKAHGKLYHFFSYGGRISYGIYIYHPAILIGVSTIVARFGNEFFSSSLYGYLAYLVISMVLIWLVSSLSFRYFESIFLRMKIKYRTVLPGA